ncbi:MAG: TGS domain-containing protein [Deltaproteobacteria bacterium]|nr:TGS domain-containing protein [Deltaproteobacteria bacterium]MBW2136590.1 TGS domain-containing protein [Deltaproteobacteria bacterium]
MPANLPPQYFEAEKRYREATTPEEKVEALEEMLMIMPKHKGTDKLRADLRRRISKVKAQAQQKKGGAKRDAVHSIEREGAAQIILVGLPNTGKSSLVAALTNASPEVADFPHSTWKPVPGMVQYGNIQFQLVDTPPLSKEHNEPWLTDLIRRGDILAILADLHGDPIQQLEDTVKILEGLRIFPEDRPVPEGLKKPPFVKKFLVLVNKMDGEKDREDFEVFLELSEMDLPCLGISARTGTNLDALLEKFYEVAGIIRVYTKAPGKGPDLSSPFVLPKGSTLEALAGKVHKDFIEKLKYAKIWGEKVYDGQMVQRDYVLQDGDMVEMHI